MIATQGLLTDVAREMQPPRLRTIAEFAEQEIVIPTGPFEGRRFSMDRQPWTRLYFRALQSGVFERIFTVAGSQLGKTFACSTIPLVYHLFETRESVIYGVPTMDMVADKWAEDIMPVIAASRFRDLLPRSGAGSKGGTPSRITFGNGQTIKFMTGGGDDKKRAGFTSRIVIVTEVDGFDKVGETSREADKFTQLEARTRAYDSRRRIIGECTPSLESGRSWQELTKGTDSRIAIRCPHCAAYVTPEREHLVGWKEAKDEIEARESARLVCSACGALWDESDRATANRNCILLHRGQEWKDGNIVGDAPRTNTLGFRVSAANNLLTTIGSVAQGEWRASRAVSEENAEKEQRQFVWALPVKPSAVDLSDLDTNSIVRRVRPFARGTCPEGTKRITVGVDTGKWLLHWFAIAWMENATPHIVDYGRMEVPSNDMAQEAAVRLALRRLRDEVLSKGWQGAGGAPLIPEMTFIDSGDNDEAVYAFCAESGPTYFPIKGFGTTQRRMDRFIRKSRQACVMIGDEYQVIQLPGKPRPLVEINVDHWKGWLHGRLTTPISQPGAMTVFKSDVATEHLALAKHLTSETKSEEFVPGKGTVTKWVAKSRANHFLDAGTYACVAGHSVGERLLGEMPVRKKMDVEIRR